MHPLDSGPIDEQYVRYAVTAIVSIFVVPLFFTWVALAARTVHRAATLGS